MTKLIAAMPFAEHLGVDLSKADTDEVVGAFEVQPQFCTLGGMAHGGALMAFADSLGAIGAYLNLPEGSRGTTTIESKINFTGPAPAGKVVTGRATPVSVGKRLSVWRIDVTDPDDKLVATVTQTQLVL